jgi:hypothetical protein
VCLRSPRCFPLDVLFASRCFFQVMLCHAFVSDHVWFMFVEYVAFKLHNEELHNLYSSPSIIRVIKSRRMRLAGHVARIGK